MAEARPLAVEQLLTLHNETLIRHAVERKEKNRRSRSKRHKTSSQQPEDTVINLSNEQLSEAEIKLLSRGLTFVPTPQLIN